MSGRIQHDPDAVGIAVWRLPGGFPSAGSESGGDRYLEVVDFDLEVEHLLLLIRAFWPSRRLIPGNVALDVEVHAAGGVPQLGPRWRSVVAHLEPKQSLVEVGDRLGVDAVNGEGPPTGCRCSWPQSARGTTATRRSGLPTATEVSADRGQRPRGRDRQVDPGLFVSRAWPTDCLSARQSL